MAAASGFFSEGLNNIGKALVDFSTNTFKVVLFDYADWARNFSTDDALADIASAARVASATLATPTWSAHVFDAVDVTFSSVTGDTCEGVALYKNGTAEANSWLIAAWGTTETGLPVTPNGGDITITWDAGANKILNLGS